jgi:DNA polymerase III epsilon subunit-like protein
MSSPFEQQSAEFSQYPTASRPDIFANTDRLPNLLLIFDVETPGLIPKNTNAIEKMPYITQLSFIVYDTNAKKIDTSYNTYINIPDNVEITPEIERLTGVTRTKCTSGVYIHQALDELYNQYLRCNQIIAHNIEFDSKMIRIELERNEQYIHKHMYHLFILFDIGFELSAKKTRFCTMKNTVDLCNIETSAVDKRGITYKYKKYPKLSELHEKLFGFIPENLHDSMIDSAVCLNCYLYLMDENRGCLDKDTFSVVK